jgi:limonene-1,2-epoxide hydrolase
MSGIQSVLEGYKVLFENLTPESLGVDFHRVFDEKVYFKDPFNEVRGLRDVRQVFSHMFENLIEPQFRVHHMAGADKTGYLEWRFYFKLKPNAQTQQINGMSKILINDQDKVVVHIDYWDSGEYVLQKVPVIGALNRWVAKKLKVK